MSSSPESEWAIIHFGDDHNWWVEDLSDPLHWDLDRLGIIDPHQMAHVIDLCDSLRDYGFDPDVMDTAFFKFRIDEVKDDRWARIVRVRDSLLDAENDLFALPDVRDEEKGPYADFIEYATLFHVKMLNDILEFESNLTTENVGREIGERTVNESVDGRAVHFFHQITSILEYVPEGYELDLGDDTEIPKPNREDLTDLPDVDMVEDEKIEEDETMRWGDEDKEAGEYEEEDDQAEQESEVEKPRRGRPRKI